MGFRRGTLIDDLRDSPLSRLPVRPLFVLLLLCLLPACVPPNLSNVPPAALPIEAATFEVNRERDEIVRAAADVLTAYGLDPGLVDPAGGMVQSDYTMLRTVHERQNLPADLYVLDQLLMRVSVRSNPRDRTVTVTTAFRPLGTADQTINRDLTTFWLDQIARDLSTTLGSADYAPRVTAARYMDGLEGRPGGGDAYEQDRMRASRALTAAGIIGGGILALALIGSAL